MLKRKVNKKIRPRPVCDRTLQTRASPISPTSKRTRTSQSIFIHSTEAQREKPSSHEHVAKRARTSAYRQPINDDFTSLSLENANRITCHVRLIPIPVDEIGTRPTSTSEEDPGIPEARSLTAAVELANIFDELNPSRTLADDHEMRDIAAATTPTVDQLALVPEVIRHGPVEGRLCTEDGGTPSKLCMEVRSKASPYHDIVYKYYYNQSRLFLARLSGILRSIKTSFGSVLSDGDVQPVSQDVIQLFGFTQGSLLAALAQLPPDDASSTPEKYKGTLQDRLSDIVKEMREYMPRTEFTSMRDICARNLQAELEIAKWARETGALRRGLLAGAIGNAT